MRTNQLQRVQNKLAALKEKEQRIKDEMAELQAKVSKEKRTRENRQKILVGAMLLAKVKAGKYPKQQLDNDLDTFLTKKADRELFDLPTSKY